MASEPSEELLAIILFAVAGILLFSAVEDFIPGIDEAQKPVDRASSFLAAGGTLGLFIGLREVEVGVHPQRAEGIPWSMLIGVFIENALSGFLAGADVRSRPLSEGVTSHVIYAVSNFFLSFALVHLMRLRQVAASTIWWLLAATSAMPMLGAMAAGLINSPLSVRLRAPISTAAATLYMWMIVGEIMPAAFYHSSMTRDNRWLPVVFVLGFLAMQSVDWLRKPPPTV
jgi:zinc transporter ZupT